MNPFVQKSGVKLLENGLTEQDIKDRGYLSFALECIDNIVKYGTDRYGKEHHDMLVTILDVETKNCPKYPPCTTCGPGARPNYFPSPYQNTTYDIKDLSWGYYGAYVWQDIKEKPGENNGLVDYNFDAIVARAVAIRVKTASKPCGIYEVIINDGKITPDKVAATYSVTGSWSQNSIYSAGSLKADEERLGEMVKLNIAALFDGRYPQKGDSADEIPIFTFLKRGLDYTKNLTPDKKRSIEPQEWYPQTDSDEWIMFEFKEEKVIDNIKIFFEVGGDYSLPADLQVAWANELDYSKAKYPDVMVVPWRGEKRQSYWKPRGSDLYKDQSLINAMIAVKKLNGNGNYLDFAKRYFKEVLKLPAPNGLLWWGEHRYYDVYSEKLMSPNGDFHEIHVHKPNWELFWEWDQCKTKEILKNIYKWHIVDKSDGKHNRHDMGDGFNPCCISMSAGQFIYALTYLYTKINDSEYLDMAKKIAKYHYSKTDPIIGLPPEGPSENPSGFTTKCCSFEVIGTMCYYMLKAYEISGEEMFRDYALQYLKNFGKYAYDEAEGKFFTLIDIHTGEPQLGSRRNSGEKPLGYADLWQPYQLGYEHPIIGAQTYAYAYYLTKDEHISYYAEKWASYISDNPPITGCRTDSCYELYARLFSKYGTFAEHYGRSISFYLTMYVCKGDNKYLSKAKEFANEAIMKLYYNGLFRGHPARNYYNNVDGVGYLIYSLIQLHVIEEYPKNEIEGLIDIDNY